MARKQCLAVRIILDKGKKTVPQTQLCERKKESGKLTYYGNWKQYLHVKDTHIHEDVKKNRIEGSANPSSIN